MNTDHKFDDYINANPAKCLKLTVILFFLLWQSVVCIFGIVFYFILYRFCCFRWWVVLLAGVATSVLAVCLQQNCLMFHVDLLTFIKEGFRLNGIFCKLLFAGKDDVTLKFLYQHEYNYIVGFSLLQAGILSLIDQFPKNPHESAMIALRKGVYDDDLQELSDKEIDRALQGICEEQFDGTLLGVSKHDGSYSVIADQDVNQVVLVLGTTGAGKTITLRCFYQRAIMKGYPLIIVDGKPDDANIDWLMNLAERNNRPFLGFNCGNKLSYDPLANGGYTELKDKIISLKDEWSSDHYRSIAEDYLQTALEVLLKSGKEFDLKMVVEYLNYEDLATLVRELKDAYLIKRVRSLENYDRNDITGLQAHLNILIHSELGKFFEKNETTFNLRDAISQNAVVYFALPALRFPSFSKVLGKLVINDIKAVIDRNINKKIFTVFDEFSVFAGDQVLNLVNMGRGKGVHAIFGTQGLADLDKVDPTFKNQVMNCINTLICHRLNDQDSAESVANWIGTQNAFVVTAQINTKQNDASMGTVKRNKEFIVHPDMIKQGLQTGDVFYITKVRKFEQKKVRVRFI